MASGDTILVLGPLNGVAPESAYATIDFLDDGSTIAGYLPVLDYAGATADEHMDWVQVLPSHYGGGDLTFTISYAAAGTVGTAMQFEVRAKAIDDGDTLTSVNIQAQTATDITDTPNGTANVMDVTAAQTISSANANGPAAGDLIIIRVSRDYDHAANADDAQVLSVEVKEA